MLTTRCRIERKETMTERHSIWQVADRLQMNLRVCQAQLVELRSYLAALDLPGDWQPPRPGSPRELHPDACPSCEVVGTHTQDCPTIWYAKRVNATPPPPNVPVIPPGREIIG